MHPDIAATPKYSLETLSILTSWKCDAACKHCVFDSSPKKRGSIGTEIALRAISETAKLTSMRRVTVSGGEAFLDPKQLAEIGRHSANLGLLFRVVTNASFATTEDRALEAIASLMPFNLESLAVSWDHFHSQFIPVEAVRNVLRACRTLGVSVRLTSVVTNSDGIAGSIEALGDEAFEVPFTQVKCQPVGRAERSVKATDFPKSAQWERGRACRSDFDTLSITFDGTVYPCCAVGGFTSGIALGRYPDQSVETLLRRRDSDPRWALLAARGPLHFVGFLNPLEREELKIDEALHDCTNCHRLFRGPLGEEAVRRAKLNLRRLGEEAFGSLRHQQFLT